MQERLARLRTSLDEVDAALSASLEEIRAESRFTQEHTSELEAQARNEAARRTGLLVDAALSEVASAAGGVSNAMAQAFRRPPADSNDPGVDVSALRSAARKQYFAERLKQKAASGDPSAVVGEYRALLERDDPDYDALEVFEEMAPGLLSQRAAAERRSARPGMVGAAQMAATQAANMRTRAARKRFARRIAEVKADMRAMVDFLIERSRAEEPLYGPEAARATRRKAKTFVGTFAGL